MKIEELKEGMKLNAKLPLFDTTIKMKVEEYENSVTDKLNYKLIHTISKSKSTIEIWIHTQEDLDHLHIS